MGEWRIYFTCPVVILSTWQPLAVSSLSFHMFHSVDTLCTKVFLSLQSISLPFSFVFEVISGFSFFFFKVVFLERVWQSLETRFMYSIPCPPRGKYLMRIFYGSCAPNQYSDVTSQCLTVSVDSRRETIVVPSWEKWSTTTRREVSPPEGAANRVGAFCPR